MLSVIEHEGVLVVSVSANGEPSNIRSERTKMLAKEISHLPRQNTKLSIIPPDILKDTRASSWKRAHAAARTNVDE